VNTPSSSPQHLNPLDTNILYPREIDPDNPEWGVGSAILLWMASVVVLLIFPIIFVAIYIYVNHDGLSVELYKKVIATEKSIVTSLLIIGVFPAHLLTLFLSWTLITSFGRRPLLKSIGWGWSPRFGFWTSCTLAIALLGLGTVIIQLIGGGKTQLDEIISSSKAARIATALLASTTAPLVEELVYRGILYPAFRKVFGIATAIFAISILFTVVHMTQYSNNPGVIVAVGILSFVLTLVRALTGRILPCVVMHLIFNGIQGVIIILEPYVRTLQDKTTTVAPADLVLMVIGL
jgi:uncharacterized protein